MPIIAVCPYCQSGRVRAPDRAIGLTASCPRCHSSFTVVDSGETEEVARRRASAAPSVPPPRPEPVPPDQAPTAANEVTALVTVPRPLPTPPTPTADEDDEPTDPARVAMVVAFLLAGGALLVSHVPYGRFGTVGAAALGGLLAAAAVFGSRRPAYPLAAAVLNGLVLVVAVLLPGWLGLPSWRPTPVNKDAHTVQILGDEGLQKPQSEWVDIGQSWQFDDVRVKGSASVGPVELVGPQGKVIWTRQRYLAVRVKVGNVGVARPIPFQGWGPATVKLTGAGGTAVPAARFETGWYPTEQSKPASLLPGKSADWLLLFELPATPTESLRLELPGAPAGVPDTAVRFQIPTRPLGIHPR